VTSCHVPSSATRPSPVQRVFEDRQREAPAREVEPHPANVALGELLEVTEARLGDAEQHRALLEHGELRGPDCAVDHRDEHRRLKRLDAEVLQRDHRGRGRDRLDRVGDAKRGRRRRDERRFAFGQVTVRERDRRHQAETRVGLRRGDQSPTAHEASRSFPLIVFCASCTALCSKPLCILQLAQRGSWRLSQ